MGGRFRSVANTGERRLKAKVTVMPGKGVLDPQGEAVRRALGSLGFEGVIDVRQGKVIELELAERDGRRAREAVEAMCERLLANKVIERHEIEILREAPPGD